MQHVEIYNRVVAASSSMPANAAVCFWNIYTYSHTIGGLCSRLAGIHAHSLQWAQSHTHKQNLCLGKQSNTAQCLRLVCVGFGGVCGTM